MPQQQKEMIQSGPSMNVTTTRLRSSRNGNARQIAQSKTKESRSLERWLKEQPSQEHWNAVARIHGQGSRQSKSASKV
jgi:hypothetical protein